MEGEAVCDASERCRRRLQSHIPLLMIAKITKKSPHPPIVESVVEADGSRVEADTAVVTGVELLGGTAEVFAPDFDSRRVLSFFEGGRFVAVDGASASVLTYRIPLGRRLKR